MLLIGEPTGPEPLTAADVRAIQDAADELGLTLVSVRPTDDGVEMEVEGDVSPEQIRNLADAAGGAVSISVQPDNAPRPSGSDEPTPAPAGAGQTGGGGGQDAGGGGQQAGGGGQTDVEQSRPRQVPGGGQVWRVGGRDIYLAYAVPGTSTPLVWRIEDPERLEAIFGPGGPDGFDRELTAAEFRGLSPWQIGGLSSELAVTEEDPWQVFMSEFERAAEIRPWLEDPSVMAVIAAAYLEGREPTQDELSQTDWWNNHTAAEREWMERAATAGDAEVRRILADATSQVADALREGGMSNPPRAVAEYIARQSLTGRWSEQKTNEQIRKVTDPFAPGQLDRGLLSVLQDPERGDAGDARAIGEGRAAVRERVRAIFRNRGVPIGTDTEPEQLRLSRITDEIMTGRRDFDDVRQSVDRIAVEQGGSPAGLDVTRQGETTVREMATRWLGPTMGDLSEQQVRQWAGRIRNDPDAEIEFREYLQGQRQAMFPGFENPNLTYEDIVQPIRQLVVQTWGQPPTDEAMLVDLANMQDFQAAQAELRREGLQRGIGNVVNNATGGMLRAVGGQIRRSADF